MKVEIDRDAFGNIIVRMKGDMSYENAAPLRNEIQSLLSKNPSASVTINMQNVDFVGASGIGQFVKTLKTVNRDQTKVRLSNVRSEFIKVFRIYDLTEQDMKKIIEDFDSDENESLGFRFGRRLPFNN